MQHLQLSKTAAKRRPVVVEEPTPSRALHTAVRLTKPKTLRRPHPDSYRTQVLEALKERSRGPGRNPCIPIDLLSRDVGFDTRPYLQKLVFQGWAEFID